MSYKPPMDDKELHKLLSKQIKINKELRSGFEDDPIILNACQSFQHRPPSHIHIPLGRRYRHVCPDCGYITYIYPNDITC